jgi:hypothetical protein
MIEFRAEGLAFKMEAHSRADAEDWAQVLVETQSNGFHGQFIAWIQTEDLTRFANQLSRMVSDLGQELTASLVSAEPDVYLELRSDHRGHIKGSYRLESERREGTPTVLSGAFDMDQSYIPRLLAKVQELTTRLHDLEQVPPCEE